VVCRKKGTTGLALGRVNMFLPKEGGGEVATEIELIRSTEEEKGRQIENVRNWQEGATPSFCPPPMPPLLPLSPRERAGVRALFARSRETENIAYLQNTARDRRNVFELLVEAVKTHSLGRISHALDDVGGEYRRNM